MSTNNNSWWKEAIDCISDCITEDDPVKVVEDRIRRIMKKLDEMYHLKEQQAKEAALTDENIIKLKSELSTQTEYVVQLRKYHEDNIRK